ncbi:hypothetical protein COT75_00760 [Candidatus Beckwithbacteria bacterium CG10_big_fil_rev_8_21_14_0_10_34_10]|uniref:Uncharacterized protein n=1 Tax=Candidatus Beckwithbacteria bacterium CG10_big_fil_rev_8_21_14_0_10_34_10 TaxID=1974495 RepID=A0A2H0WAV9_9BACT|nr:MAG: hypothetical protein COT75_00760 [Candidatus Beckwithbacteria bacterium CG10_big_fil_rev_8_21_14_0_10_34_10]
MVHYTEEKTKAIKLRKNGLSYSEIIKKVKVSKSTLSYWLSNIKLNKKQQNRINKKKTLGRLKALERIKQKRKKITNFLLKKGKTDIGKISQRDLFILGIALYWAEGAKQKASDISHRVSFSNSDPKMIKTFLIWLINSCKITKEQLSFELYIHKEIDKKTVKLIKNFWLKTLKINGNFLKIRYKKHQINKLKNLKTYYGLIRIDVQKSTNFNRLIKGWILGIANNLNNNWGVV